MVKLLEINEEQDRKHPKRFEADDTVPVISPGTIPDGEPAQVDLVEAVPFGWLVKDNS